MKRRKFLTDLSTGAAGLIALPMVSYGGTSDLPIRLEEISIPELSQAYQSGTLTIREVVGWYLDRIEQIDKRGPALNSILALNPDALSIAESLDQELKAGTMRGPLHGVPVVLKDNINTGDKMPTTAGSRALAGSLAAEDSPVAAQLREAGAVILGKANLSEWANFRADFSSSGWSGLGGQTRNPYVLERNPCGSSSGSAVAVSANLCMVAIGTETNGSIVCPSNANGIVGIKPTVGLISRTGIIPISFTQDTAGPMARTVTDAAITLGVLTASDPADDKTSDPQRKSFKDYTRYLNEKGLEGKRIGVYNPSRNFHHKVAEAFDEALDNMRSAGAILIELEDISKVNVGGDSFTVMLYEFKHGLNRYFKSLGPDAPVKSLEELIAFNKKDSIELRYFDQDLLIKANEKGDLEEEAYQNALARMLDHSRKKGIDRVMSEHGLDAITAPTGSPAWKTDLVNGDRFLGGSSSPAAHAGYPSISVPMAFLNELPVGISFFGQAWTEGKLIEIAYAFEQLTRVRKAPGYISEE